jgi:dUTP pyrophosphatase
MKEIKIKLTRGAQIPKYATNGSAAVDLCAMIDSPITLAPGERALIPTGIALSIPDGYVGVVAARSGLACKKGICLSNGIGVIDSDYRGEISDGLFNSSKDEFTVERGERIAQLMFVPVESAVFVSTDSLDETERGEGGFGSTGTK